MKIIFAGYRSWSYQILKNLSKCKSKKWQIVSILTNLEPEENFNNLGLPCYSFEPKTFDAKTIDVIKKNNPDILLFYGWSWLIPPSLHEKFLCLCLHTSPLPKYRGGSPLQNQIIKGEKTSAVSIFKMIKELDAGDIYGQRTFSLSGNMNQIFHRIVKVGTEETLRVLDGLANGNLKPVKQNSSQATVFKRRQPEDSEITIDDFKTKTAKELYDFIRALEDPYPNAFIKDKKGNKLLLTGAHLEEN